MILLFSRRQTITPIGTRLDIYVISQLEDDDNWGHRLMNDALAEDWDSEADSVYDRLVGGTS